MRSDYADVIEGIDALKLSDLITWPPEQRERLDADSARIERRIDVEAALAKIDETFAAPLEIPFDESIEPTWLAAPLAEHGGPPSAPALDPAVRALPGGGAFGALLAIDLREVSAPYADEITFGSRAPSLAIMGGSPWTKLKGAYTAVKQFLSQLRAGVTAFHAKLLHEAPVSVEVDVSILGDVRLNARQEPGADGAAWSAASAELTRWKDTQVAALVTSIAVLGKAVELVVKIVTAVINSYKAVKVLFEALMELYRILSELLTKKA